jgi:hypothetical protein
MTPGPGTTHSNRRDPNLSGVHDPPQLRVVARPLGLFRAWRKVAGDSGYVSCHEQVPVQRNVSSFALVISLSTPPRYRKSPAKQPWDLK